jgi:hypothetical protein
MKSILIALGASAVLVSAASAQSAAEKALPGKWTCSAEGNGMAVTSTTSYLAGGKETFDLTVKGDSGAGEIEFTGSGTGDWKFGPDAKLVETITGITIKSARMGGQEVPAANMQAMVEGMIVGQTSTSTVDIKDKAMVLVDADNITTNCKR